MAIVYNRLAGTPGGGGRAGFGYKAFSKTNDLKGEESTPLNRGVETVKDAAVSAADVISWIFENWQAAIVAALAIVLLIKRL